MGKQLEKLARQAYAETPTAKYVVGTLVNTLDSETVGYAKRLEWSWVDNNSISSGWCEPMSEVEFEEMLSGIDSNLRI